MSEKFTVYRFYTDSCVPCKHVAAMLKSILEEHEGSFDVVDLDVAVVNRVACHGSDGSENVMFSPNIVPTLLFTKRATIIDVVEGVPDRDRLERVICDCEEAFEVED